MSLLKHCADGNLAGIQAALKNQRTRRVKLQQRDNHNWSCLHHAVKSGNVECIKYLLTMEQLDTTAETFEGETALHIACSIPNVSLEIVTALIEANPDLVNFVNNEEVDLLQCAIERGRLDLVNVLIDNGCPVNKQDLDGDTALHIAVIELRWDIVKYLLYHTECDATIRNEVGKAACNILFRRLLTKLDLDLPLLSEEVECFEDLTRFTYDSVDVNDSLTHNVELRGLNSMVYLLYHFKQPKGILYTTIAKSFYVPPSKRYFVDKVLQSNARSYHCIVTALLLDINYTDSVDTHTGAISVSYTQRWESRSEFLLELYTLFLSDESFFSEYVSELMSVGWKFSDLFRGTYQVWSLREYITESLDTFEPQKLFTFFKTLALHEYDFKVFMFADEIEMTPAEMLSALVPLVNFVLPYNRPANSLNCNYNFNESGDVFHDVHRKADPDIAYEVVSLQNLCRMSVRRYYFENYSHYDALQVLYSLKVPLKFRNFLCYNYGNLNF